LIAIGGIKPRLRDYGILEASLPKLSEKAMEDGCHLSNPRPCSADDMLRLYRQAW
jgi:4-hydroxybutyrate dehydrogenase